MEARVRHWTLDTLGGSRRSELRALTAHQTAATGAAATAGVLGDADAATTAEPAALATSQSPSLPASARAPPHRPPVSQDCAA